MMGNLILNSLEIQGFRGFRHLQIGQLGRVNLIVGKNNVGKSSLLEALRLYARRAYPPLIWEILRERDESIESSSNRYTDVEKMLSSLRYLFYGRSDIEMNTEPIRIGPVKSADDTLSLGIDWYTLQLDREGRRRVQLTLFDDDDLVDSHVPRFTVQLGEQMKLDYPLKPGPLVSPRLLGSDLREINNVFIEANGLTKRQIGELWSNISLTPLEKDVLFSLRIVAPGVEALNIIGESASTRAIIVKVASIDNPVPLRSLGNGMLRTLGIALALVNAKDGILLIDEIENGLHYSVQPDIWRLVFRLAHHLNIQVFATTHSWDCIGAFQVAAQESGQKTGMLLRLENKEGEMVVTLFDERKVGIATREQIEVR